MKRPKGQQTSWRQAQHMRLKHHGQIDLAEALAKRRQDSIGAVVFENQVAYTHSEVKTHEGAVDAEEHAVSDAHGKNKIQTSGPLTTPRWRRRFG